MPLTPAQLATLKADVQANTATIPAGQPWSGIFAGIQVRDVPNSSDGNAAVAGWYNLTASPDYTVWRDLPITTVLNLITFANMTPVDAADGTQTWANRSLACQGKQLNLQNLILGRATAPMKLTNFRSAIQDALTGLPAGAGGAVVGANWPGVRDAAKFLATNFEKVFAVGAGTPAAPSDLTIEGRVTVADVSDALNL